LQKVLGGYFFDAHCIFLEKNWNWKSYRGDIPYG